MKKILRLWPVLLTLSLAVGVVQDDAWAAKKSAPAKAKKGGKKPMMTIKMAKGTIKIELFPGDAPKTVAQITKLANKGFYNGVIFHRVEPGFVVQGGDPSGTGTGGSGTKLPAEFNKRKHVKGTVAMARTNDPNSADSQFYICLGPAPFLDNQYTVFGQVTEGQDVVDQIKVGDKMVEVKVETK